MQEVKKKASGQSRARVRPQPSPTLSSPEVVYDEILRGLYEGRYVPGQRLIEAELTFRLNVSRGSIREALNRLSAEGVVALSRHKGANIRTLSRREVRNILQIMELLIGLSARLAAESVEATGGELLHRCLSSLLKLEGTSNFGAIVHARNDYYRALIRMGGSAELGRLLPSLHVHMVRIQFRQYSSTTEQIRFSEFQQLADAILSGDPVRAEIIARAHVLQIQSSIDRLPDSAFTPENIDSSNGTDWNE